MDNNTVIYIAIAALAVYLLMRRLGSKKAPSSLILEKIRSGAKIIDVRTPDEFSMSSYPKAENIPIDSLPARMDELPKDKPIILYCASGSRNAKAARMLKKAGFACAISAGGLRDMPR